MKLGPRERLRSDLEQDSTIQLFTVIATRCLRLCPKWVGYRYILYSTWPYACKSFVSLLPNTPLKLHDSSTSDKTAPSSQVNHPGAHAVNHQPAVNIRIRHALRPILDYSLDLWRFKGNKDKVTCC